MTTQEFSQKYKIPILNKDSQFPDYYATHVVDNLDVLNQEKLMSAKKLGKANYSTKIDEYLGATDFVFFGLGKGYLCKNKPSIGLIYDPLELVKFPDANLVENDLLYELEKEKLLDEFCIKNWPEIEKILQNKYSIDEIKSFREYLIKNEPILVIDLENVEQKNNAEIFEELLVDIDADLAHQLKELLDEAIVQKYTIKNNLDSKIKEIFKNEKDFLNIYFDEAHEERLIEIRIPGQYPISKGLIGLYEN